MSIQPAEPDLDHASGGIASGVDRPISIHFCWRNGEFHEEIITLTCAVYVS